MKGKGSGALSEGRVHVPCGDEQTPATSPIAARLCIAGLHAVEQAFGAQTARACRDEAIARVHACSPAVIVMPADPSSFLLRFAALSPTETYERCEAIRHAICDEPFAAGGQRCLLSATLTTAVADSAAGADRTATEPLYYFDGPPAGDRLFHTTLQRIVDDEVVLFYQPFRQLTTAVDERRRLSGELLSRLRRHGEVCSFGAFLSIAERHGFMPALDCALIDKAIAAIARMHDGRADHRVSINVAATSLDAGRCSDRILASIRANGLEPGRVSLEITEGTRAEYPVRAANTIERLRAAGVTVGLDDFGTGYNELRLLRSLPVDYVKISGEFLPHSQGDRRDWTIIDSIVELAHKLGALTVAEGVERIDTLDALQAHELDYAQGYLIGRPRPASA